MRGLNDGVAYWRMMHDILRPHKIFPHAVTNVIQTGEKTGRLSQLLLSAAAFPEYEAETMFEDLTSIIEPLPIVGMGAAVGFMHWSYSCRRSI